MVEPAPEARAAPPRSDRPVARRLPRSLVWGAAIVGAMIVIAVLAPLVVPYPYDQMHFDARLRPPSAAFWLGTDEFGRDVFTRVLVGARSSLFIGFAATAIGVVIGVPFGLVAGYYGGRLDELIMRSMDVLISIPPVLLGLLILALTPPALWKAAVAVGLVFVPPIVRVTRSVTLNVVHEEYILAAKARGEHAPYVLVREILPNAWPPIIVEASLRVTFAILLGAALSFLGFGAQPPSSDWGLMISEARPHINQAPWIALSPGIAMCVTVIGVNLFGDGLREALDPRLGRRRHQ